MTNVYKDEINQYAEVIEHIVKLPFIQAILDENKSLKQDIQLLQIKMDSLITGNNNNSKVVLEIIDLPIVQTFQNLDSVLLADDGNNRKKDDHVQSSDDDSSSSEEEEEDEPSADEEEEAEEVVVKPTFPVVINTGVTSLVNDSIIVNKINDTKTDTVVTQEEVEEEEVEEEEEEEEEE